MRAVDAGHTVRVRAPATSANLGPGFDAFGLALQRYDEVSVRPAERLRIQVTGEGADSVPRTREHLVVMAMQQAFTSWGVDIPGLDLQCTNDLPHGRGLGSSAAAIVTGLVAARALIEDDISISDIDLLQLAARIEGHPDNVAACLYGGLTIAWSTDVDSSVRCVRLEPHPDIRPVVLVPATAMSTNLARGLLPLSIPRQDAAFTASRSALLVVALTQRPDLLHTATDDRIHQPYRAAAMPETAALLSHLRANGVPAVISGAGPSLLAFADRDDFDELAGAEWQVHRVGIDLAGVQVVTSSDADGVE